MPRKKSRKPKVSKKNKKSSQKTFLRKLLLNKISYSLFCLFFVCSAVYIAYLNMQINQKMSGRIWSLPSHVYARPLELYQGKVLQVNQLIFELRQLDYRRVNNRPKKPGEYRLLNEAYFEIITRDFTFWDGKQKSQGIRLSFYNNKVSKIVKLYSDEEVTIVRMEPMKVAGIYPAQKQERQLIKLSDVPDNLVLALLAIEDKRFYQHWGIDPQSIARALLANIMAGKTVQGGSTLTQQLVKNLFLSADRTLIRKVNEALMSLLLELNYDKSTILETYINEVYLGQNGSRQIHGFELASQFYFAKPLTKIRRDQMALLVGLVKGPSWYSPRRHQARAVQRRNQVLSVMHEQGVLNAKQYKKYTTLGLGLGLTKKPKSSSNHYPALIDLVKRQLLEDYSSNDLKTSGLKVFTSIDPIIQEQAEKTVRQTLKQLEKRPTSSALQVAVIIASSQQGEIQAMVSDKAPNFHGFNRSLDAVRQIGSLIKPAIYLSALQRPEKYSLVSMLDDSPLHIKTTKDDVWSPQNYDKKFSGSIPLYLSLETSRNVPTVRLGLDLGLSEITTTLHNLGVERSVPTYPSMTLGAFNLSPFDVANMYQTFATGGYHVPLKIIREVMDKHDKPLKRYPLQSNKTLDEKPVYLLNTILQRVAEVGTARALVSSLPGVQVAGKTGTTDNLRDSWFVGFTDDQLGVVWIGRDDNKSTGLTGASGALRLWSNLFSRMNINSLMLEPPTGISMAWVDPESGGILNKNCQGAIELPFIDGSLPSVKAECKSLDFIEKIKRLFD